MLRRARRLLNQAALGDNVGGVQATRSSSPRQFEPWYSRSSSAATRIESGMLRLLRRDFGVPYSPRTKFRRMRTRCAAQSMSCQRRATNSPCRAPVIAAVM